MLSFFKSLQPITLVIIILMSIEIGNTQSKSDVGYDYDHPIPYAPMTYVCHKSKSIITVDGIMEDSEWSDIPWTNAFVDIQGPVKADPYLDTRAKMTWDDDYFYIAALLEEPHIWATLTERDAIMYHDDDFEVFIDPDSDGHNYFEFEMNAYNAIWDLYMLYPYYIDDRRNYIMNWDIRNIKTAVHISGSINDPSDNDEYWSLEIAIPWSTFSDFKSGSARPINGDQWRVNFSRVDWTMEVKNRKYVKVNGDNGKPLPENNWVWSPTGYINMHKPETWGFVQFESSNESSFTKQDDEKIKWGLWQTYYQMKECWSEKSTSCTISDIKIPSVAIDGYQFHVTLNIHDHGYTLTAPALDNMQYVLDHRARIIKTATR